MYKYPEVKTPLAFQYFSLKLRCNGRVEICDNDRSIYWKGVIKPLPFAREYSVAIKYSIDQNPICVVQYPDLEALAAGRKIPHTYPKNINIPGTVLCLYLPKLKDKNNISEWLPTERISETIIPWASLWLSYFEDWLHTDEWQGGGVDHE